MHLHTHRPADLAWLAGIDIFHTCTNRELKRVQQLTMVLDVPAGTELCRQGEAGRQSFIVVTGRADVLIDGAKIAEVGPATVIGEMSLLDGAPRVASVVAATPMTVLVSTQRELASLVTEVPHLARKLLTIMSDRLRDADGALASRTPRGDADR